MHLKTPIETGIDRGTVVFMDGMNGWIFIIIFIHGLHIQTIEALYDST